MSLTSIILNNSNCPGRYCGRILYENGSLSNCGACPRGYRVKYAVCTMCNDSLTLYDWLYLGFMAILPLLLHFIFIDSVTRHKSLTKDGLIFHCSAILEILLSSFMTILLLDPFGSFDIRSCAVNRYSDWYTYLYNPEVNYQFEVYCTQEAVYPLYTAVFILYGLNLMFMLLIRPWFCSKFLPDLSKMSIYSALYFLPILILSHAFLAGVFYYWFSYVIIAMSLISNALHFSIRIDQSWKSLIWQTLSQPRNLVILIIHWLLHGYGIMSLIITYDHHNSYNETNMLFNYYLLILVPLPAIFYILTSQLTKPGNFY